MTVPLNFSKQQIVRIVPTAGTCPCFDAGLAKAISGEILPERALRRLQVSDIAGGPPEISADIATPLPYIAIAVLTQVVDEVAILFRQFRAHQLIRRFQFRRVVGVLHQLLIGTQIVLQKIVAPLREQVRILRLMLVAAFKTAAGQRAGRNVDADFETLGYGRNRRAPPYQES